MVCVKGMHTKQPDAVLTEMSAGVTGKLPAVVLIDAPPFLTSDAEAETVIGVLEVLFGLFCFCVVSVGLSVAGNTASCLDLLAALLRCISVALTAGKVSHLLL